MSASHEGAQREPSGAGAAASSGDVSGPLLRLGTEHLGAALTLGYLAVTSVGMVSSWALYDRFGVNVFHFAQIGDFLLAATAWPLASISVVVAVLLIAMLRRLDRLGDRYRWYRLMYLDSDRVRRVLRSKTAWVVYSVLYVWLAADTHANWYERRMLDGEGAAVRVQFQTGTYQGRDASLPFEAQLIGATTAYVFLYDRASRQATVVPVENLASLVPMANGRAP